MKTRSLSALKEQNVRRTIKGLWPVCKYADPYCMVKCAASLLFWFVKEWSSVNYVLELYDIQKWKVCIPPPPPMNFLN